MSCDKESKMKLCVEYIPIDDIKPYAGNAKLHPEWQIEQIMKSISNLEFLDPVAIWHGEIVEGHGRYEAAKRLGMHEIPVIRLDDLTDEQRRAYGLIHNQLTMNSGFDLAAIEAELESISDIDMNNFGFDEPFSMDDIEEVQGYDEENDNREFFNVTLNLPTAKKKQITKYLRKHKAEIVQKIIEESEE